MKLKDIKIGTEYATWRGNRDFEGFVYRVKVLDIEEIQVGRRWENKTATMVKIQYLDSEGRPLRSEHVRPVKIKMTYEDWKAERKRRMLAEDAHKKSQAEEKALAAKRNGIVADALVAKLGEGAIRTYDLERYRKGEGPNHYTGEALEMSTENLAKLLGVVLPTA